MDIWSPEQLRRMQLGGTARFMSFLRSYPRLCGPPQTARALSTRYCSLAAAHYRHLLDVCCQGGDAATLKAPPPDQGHWPSESSQQPSERPSHDFDQEDERDTTIGSLEEEEAAFEAACRQHQQCSPSPDVVPTSLDAGPMVLAQHPAPGPSSPIVSAHEDAVRDSSTISPASGCAEVAVGESTSSPPQVQEESSQPLERGN